MNITEFNEMVAEATPAWIEDGLEFYDIESIQQGGCASGAYMPAVTYFTAKVTMNDHGDDVLQYIADNLGELPSVPEGESWAGIAVFFLSYAVELWANQFDIDEMEDAT